LPDGRNRFVIQFRLDYENARREDRGWSIAYLAARDREPLGDRIERVQFGPRFDRNQVAGQPRIAFMKFSSFARLFGGREKHSTRKRGRGLHTPRPAPALEALEPRLVPAGLIPTIVKVTPVDGSTALSALPQISVTFSESMQVAGVTNPANYDIFGSAGNPIQVNSVSYNPVSNAATLSYTGNATGGDLTADKYTLFVRGDQLIASNGEPVAPPGQIAVASAGSSTVSIVNMPGDGTLHGISNYSAGLNNGPAAVAIADVNQDGLPDLIVGNFESDSISIFDGIAGGGFATSPSQTLNTGALAVQGIVAADFLNNGQIDLATANVGSNNVSVFLNQGHGVFGQPTIIAVGGAPDAITAAKFDPSGFNDLAVARSDGSVAILLNNGVGGFGAPTVIATGRGILNGIDAGNLAGNSGHNADIIVGGSLGVAELVNNTTQQGVLNFATPIVLDTTAVVDVAIGTLTPGGLPSVAAATKANGGEVLVYTNEAGGFSNGIPYVTGAVPTRVRFGDVNGDGFNDLIVSNGDANSGSVSILYNVSGTTFNVSPAVPIDVNPAGLAIHNNAQGVVDLVATANIDADDASVLRVAGGQFLASTDTFAPSSLGQPVVGDLNGDGIPSS
jgi:hypothetical protein